MQEYVLKYLKTEISINRILFGILLVFAAAQIVIPMEPVNITLHTMAALLIGLTYRPGEALITFASFIALGLAGIPVFSNLNSGLLYLSGPVGGYYIGMTLAAFFMALLRSKFVVSNLLNCAIGQILIYVPGIAYLSTFIGFDAAIYKGFFVYIPSGIVKIALLLALLRVLKHNK
mgnify:CR=1 FL=1